MLKEKKTKTIQIRIDDQNYEKLKDIAFMMGTTPSGLARQLIQMSINAHEIAFKPAVNEMNERALELKKETEKSKRGLVEA